MTESGPDRPRPSDAARSTVLLGDVTASSVTAWSVLGELRPLAPLTGGGDSRQLWRTPPPAPSPADPVEQRRPEPRPQARRPQTREQGQQTEQLAQRDRQAAAQRARDEDTRQRQARTPQARTPQARMPRDQNPQRGQGGGERPGSRRSAPTALRQEQSTVRWTAQPTARGAPQRSTAAGPGDWRTPPSVRGPGRSGRPRSERSRVSPVRIVGLVVVVLVLAGRCLSGLT